MTRPETTLFLPISVDGRITSGDSNRLDPDKKWKSEPFIMGIIQQFFEFSQGGGHTVTSGETLAGMGVNDRDNPPKKTNINLVVLDDQTSLTPKGIMYASLNFNHIYMAVLSNHPITSFDNLPENVTLMSYEKELNLKDITHRLGKKKVKELSIQSNGRFNARWLEEGLVDHLSVIISPLLVGGHGTPTLIDKELLSVKPLVLTVCKAFGGDYVNVRYDVLNEPEQEK